MSEQHTAPATTDLPRAAVTALLRRTGRDVPDAAIDPRYGTLRDRRLAAALVAEDLAERDGFDPLERLTCRTHRRWVHDCISAPAHVFVVTGHRWCRGCEQAADVAVDQLTWEVKVTCPRCRRTPESAATKQIVRTCRASLAAARGD